MNPPYPEPGPPSPIGPPPPFGALPVPEGPPPEPDPPDPTDWGGSGHTPPGQGSQAPPTQYVADAQALSHAPQCWLLCSTSTHAPLHVEVPAGH